MRVNSAATLSLSYRTPGLAPSIEDSFARHTLNRRSVSPHSSIYLYIMREMDFLVGTGKTALVDLIAHCYENRLVCDDENSFVRRIAEHMPKLTTAIELLEGTSWVPPPAKIPVKAFG